MKLIEYRFPEMTKLEYNRIAQIVQDYFISKNDFLLIRHYVTNPDNSQKQVWENIHTSELLKLLCDSIEMSFSLSIPDYSLCSNFKSMKTCRFIFVGDDGVIRVCHAYEDDIINFNGLGVEFFDVSPMLIETDIFDCV